MEVLLKENLDLAQNIKVLVNNNQQTKIRVKGNSMFPFLRHERDLVILSKPVIEELQPGTIVLFRQGERYVLHRIIYQSEKIYYIRGDNARTSEYETASPDDIIGMVVAVQRGNKEIACDNPWWWFLSYLWMHTHSLRLRLYPVLRIIKHQLKRKKYERKA